ncbi:MAG: asparagine synthase (glutamine-hydrolyzing) [Lacibacter sp.]
MCRIAGIYDPSIENLQQQIVSMRDAMQHGGPDDAGIFVHPVQPLAFGHRRLSLIDLSEAGHQPMTDGELTIVYNGEIYNYKELKSTLQHYGHQFRTESDTEVILKAYRQWGTEAFEFLNGMFALAILDEEKQKLVLARDHAGIKPLYYYKDRHCLYFASEIRAFQYVDKQFEENKQWQTAFLTFGHLPEPITTLKHVVPLEKGTTMVVDLPSLKASKHCFFKWKFSGKLKNEEEAFQLIRETMEQAVERHLVSDAPIGLFLSGGIDSSLLTLIASKIQKENLHTLSIVFNERQFSEDRFQKLIIEQTNAHHQSFLVTNEIFNERLHDAMQAMDQPTLDGINTYFISMYAKAYGLKAVLSGLGADELFGGYPSFNQHRRMNFVKKAPGSLLKGLQLFPDHRIRKLSYAGMDHSAAEYLSYRGIFTPVSVASLLGTTEKQIEEELEQLSTYYPINGLSDGNRVSWIETNFYMQNQLLKDSDFMSMWHGLEIRVPFLDKEMMIMAGVIDEAIKFKKNPPKYLLVKSFQQELPEQIWKRKKQGFTFPFEGWLKENAYIQPSTPAEHKLYNDFQRKRLSWGRYWCALLMNRFADKELHATA